MSSDDSAEVIVWNSGSHCLGGRTREEFFTELKGLLAGRVIQAWIFGSVATGEYKNSSDVDLILVVQTKLSFPDRPSMFNDLWDLSDRIDLLVYTPEEFEELIANPSSGFWTTVTRQMIRLI